MANEHDRLGISHVMKWTGVLITPQSLSHPSRATFFACSTSALSTTVPGCSTSAPFTSVPGLRIMLDYPRFSGKARSLPLW
jgi:hypothetical protein